MSSENSASEQNATAARPSKETVKEEPFFGGGDWRWGVRPSRETVKKEPFFSGGNWRWGVRTSRPDFWD